MHRLCISFFLIMSFNKFICSQILNLELVDLVVSMGAPSSATILSNMQPEESSISPLKV